MKDINKNDDGNGGYDLIVIGVRRVFRPRSQQRTRANVSLLSAMVRLVVPA
jgi:hypothetical protein